MLNICFLHFQLTCVMTVKENHYQGIYAQRVGVITFLGTDKKRCEVNRVPYEGKLIQNVLKCDLQEAQLRISCTRGCPKAFEIQLK